MTMKHLLIPLALLLVSMPAAADITGDDVARLLPADLTHPYLFFTEEEKPAILARIEEDHESADIMARLLVEANRLMYTPVDMKAPAQQKNPRYWSDGSYNGYVGAYRKNVLTLAFVYQMTGEEKYAHKAYEFADALCDLHLWMYRAHEFPIIYSRVWPWSGLLNDDQVVFNYDIRTGDMATELGIAYDWLYTGLNKAQRDRIRGALLEKAILLARDHYDYHWWASSYKCNWCGICMTGLGVSSLALLTEDPSLVDVVAETYNRLGRMFEYLGVDGGWQEGRSYWAYGMRACIFFMEPMNRVSDSRHNLFQHERVRENPASFALYGLTGYFGDGSGGKVGSTHLINKLTTETGDTDAAWYRENMLGTGRDMFDILWPRPDVTPVEPTVVSKHFKSIDWAIMRTAFDDPSTVTVACKAGYNDDPHHGHLDIGHFSIWWHDQFFVTDLGSGRYFYDEKYFNEERWQYPQASSAGHNVVFVDGELQLVAKHKDEPWEDGIGGDILEFRTSDTRDYTLMDPTNAYPGTHLRKWRRHIILDKPVVTVVLDEVVSARGAEIETRFHPGVDMEARDTFVLLEGDPGTMALITVSTTPVAYRPGRHAYLPVRRDANFDWIPYVGAVVTASAERTVLGTVVLPVEDADEATAVASSMHIEQDGNDGVVVSFAKDGGSFRYEFRMTGEGLVLAE
jgi:hypothetical protein